MAHRDGGCAGDERSGQLLGRDPRLGDRDVHPTAQIFVRASDYPTGYAKGRSLEGLLDKIGPPPPGGVGWPLVIVNAARVVIKAVHISIPTTFIGSEQENRRQLFTINLRMSLGDG